MKIRQAAIEEGQAREAARDKHNREERRLGEKESLRAMMKVCYRNAKISFPLTLRLKVKNVVVMKRSRRRRL